MIGAPLEPGTRVLLRMPDWLGDFVMAEPAVRALAAHVGPSNLSVAGSEHLLALLTGGSAEAQRIPHAPGTRGTAADWRGHDVALLLTGSFRSAWTAVRAGIGRRVGWARDARALLLTDGFRPPLERGAVPLGLGRAGRRPRILPRPFPAAVSDLLGFVGVRVLDPHPRIEVEEGIEVELAARLEGLGLARTQPFLAANVGSRPGSAKGYPHGSFARAIERVRAETGLATVLVAGPGEEESVREVEARLGPGPAVIGAVDPPLGLLELAALFRRARFVMTADTGPRHIAVAVGAPVACVLGPTDPRHTADHLERTALARVPVPCGPCHRERCPIEGEGHLACMASIPPDEFARLALSLVE